MIRSDLILPVEDNPVDFSAFLETARQLGMYWLVLNEPSPPPRDG